MQTKTFKKGGGRPSVNQELGRREGQEDLGDSGNKKILRGAPENKGKGRSPTGNNR